MSAFLRNTGSLGLEATLESAPPSIAGTNETESPLVEAVPEAKPNSGYSGVEEHSSPFHAFLEHSTSYIFPGLFVLNLHLTLVRLYELDWLWLAALAIPLSLLLGDFVSGLVHWTADTYFSEDTPIVGQSLIKPFRLHHIYPRDICTHDLVTTVGNVCILAVPVLSISLYVLWRWPVPAWLAFAILCLTLMTAATVATNQFHKWAHQEKSSGFVAWLQRKRLVLEPLHHQEHHTKPFNMHYCITNGWLNPLLNKIKFFRALEAVLRFLGVKQTN
ncbi:MAG: fatty acid desaturase CarF family protein [Pyrinomonadaceae bacterium]